MMYQKVIKATTGLFKELKSYVYHTRSEFFFIGEPKFCGDGLYLYTAKKIKTTAYLFMIIKWEVDTELKVKFKG